VLLLTPLPVEGVGGRLGVGVRRVLLLLVVVVVPLLVEEMYRLGIEEGPGDEVGEGELRVGKVKGVSEG